MQERAAILQLHAGSLPLADDVALPDLATACHGYSGADLAALCREAAMTALSDAAAAILEGTAFLFQLCFWLHCRRYMGMMLRILLTRLVML